MGSKKIAILQSSYIPWKGYFDLINSVDAFVFYDCVQYTKNDWRNRNIIYGKQGSQWLTIPVYQKNLEQSIADTTVARPNWSRKHWQAIQNTYAKAPFFKHYATTLYEAFKKVASESYLCKINYHMIQILNDLLGINTKIYHASEFEIGVGKTARLIRICKALNGTHYISGPSAKAYLDTDLFQAENINVSWMDYTGYPSYPQLTDEFNHSVSILDLLFNVGPQAQLYMKSFNN